MDPEGDVSSKRFCTLLCVLLLAFAFVADIFFDVKLDAVIIDPMSNIAMFGLGAVAGEKILSSLTIRPKEEESNES